MIEKQNFTKAMRYIVTIILIVVSIGNTIAQSGGTKPVPTKKQPTELNKLQQQIESAENAFQNYLNSKSALKKKLKKQVSDIQNRHEKVKTAYEALINEQQEQLKACQDTLAVFRFFSNTEETIFADSTLERNGWSKKLKGAYLTQYETISKIREVSLAISEVENTINKMSGQKQEKGWNDEQLQTAIALEIGNTVNNTIAKQLDDISKMDLSFLSPKQKEYYKKQSSRFDKIFNTYF